jgi:hypothetical protein
MIRFNIVHGLSITSLGMTAGTTTTKVVLALHRHEGGVAGARWGSPMSSWSMIRTASLPHSGREDRRRSLFKSSRMKSASRCRHLNYGREARRWQICLTQVWYSFAWLFRILHRDDGVHLHRFRCRSLLRRTVAADRLCPRSGC